MTQRTKFRSGVLVGAALLAAATSGFGLSSAHAANPTESRIYFSIKRVSTESRFEDLVIRITHYFPDSQTVEAGGSCVVELSACVSEFVPLGQEPQTDRSCEPVVIGSKTVGAGSRSVRFNLRTKPVASPPHSGRQVSFQTESTCTDSISAQAIIVSDPRAKKVSRTDGRGINRNKFLRMLKNSLS